MTRPGLFVILKAESEEIQPGCAEAEKTRVFAEN
jgi:hypothetical protein